MSCLVLPFPFFFNIRIIDKNVSPIKSFPPFSPERTHFKSVENTWFRCFFSAYYEALRTKSSSKFHSINGHGYGWATPNRYNPLSTMSWQSATLISWLSKSYRGFQHPRIRQSVHSDYPLVLCVCDFSEFLRLSHKPLSLCLVTGITFHHPSLRMFVEMHSLLNTSKLTLLQFGSYRGIQNVSDKVTYPSGLFICYLTVQAFRV